MYSINGVALDNEIFGWSLLRRSQPLLGVTKELSSVSVPGRHGVLRGVPAYKGAPTVTLVIRTLGASLEALYATFEANGGTGLFSITADTDRSAVFELMSIDPQGINAEDELVNVSVTLRFPTSDWRATARTAVAPASVSTPVQDFTAFANIGSDITDGDIFVGGNFGNFQLIDAGSGSWVKTAITWPHVASTGLLYVGATGQAFRAATSSPWVPVTDMTNYVEVSGGGGFRISPTWTTDPSDRIAQLELTTTSQSGVTFGVRGFNAYALRNGDL